VVAAPKSTVHHPQKLAHGGTQKAPLCKGRLGNAQQSRDLKTSPAPAGRSPAEPRTIALHPSGAARHLPYRGGFSHIPPENARERSHGCSATVKNTACCERARRDRDYRTSRPKAFGRVAVVAAPQ
jgi:hypothetical protein